MAHQMYFGGSGVGKASTDDTVQMFNVKGQRSRSQRKVMYQQQKHYNTAMDRFSDFKLGMAS